MPQSDRKLEIFYAQDRQAWREWLEKNHTTSNGVWLMYYKVKSGKPSIRYSEAVKEAYVLAGLIAK